MKIYRKGKKGVETKEVKENRMEEIGKSLMEEIWRNRM